MVLDAFKGNFTTKYLELEAYLYEMKRSNIWSTVQVELSMGEMREGRRVFKRMFVCLDACKRGLKRGRWPIIGLDAFFLQIEFKGELLVDLGRDRDDKNFLIAWACVKNGLKCSL